MSLRDKLRPHCRAAVLQALQESAGDQSGAAKNLGVHRNTLARLVRDCEINVDQLKKNWASAQLIADPPLGSATSSRLPAPRYRLPQNRVGATHRFEVVGVRCYVTVNCYEDGMPGELFLKVGKVGESERGWTDAFSIAFSMLLQQGTPLQILTDKFRASRFEPSGITSNSEIKIVTSVLDYVMRWLDRKYSESRRR